MTITIAANSVPKPPADITEGFRNAPTSIISDNLAIHRALELVGPGEINVPVTIGGSVISPGDIVVGDGDGVVSFPAAGAATLLEAVRVQSSARTTH